MPEDTLSADCPAQLALAVYVEQPDSSAAQELDKHLRGCSDCRQQVFALASQKGPKAPLRNGAKHEPGSCVGRFVLRAQIGRGTMGEVFEAEDPTLDRLVALKLLRVNSVLADSEQLRLLREAQSLAKLNNPHVVAVYDAGRDGSEVFIAMERLHGVSFDQWIARDKPDWKTIVAMILGASEGLSAAHAANLVHRDVKPKNIMVAGDKAVLVDFGLVAATLLETSTPDLDVRLTSTGAMVGTPAYASPEQLEGREATALSDVFSLSVTLFEALTGSRPHQGENLDALRTAIKTIQDDSPRQPGLKIPQSVWRALRKGLSANPRDRQQSMERWSEEIALALQSATGARRKALAGLTVLTVVALVALILGLAPSSEASCKSGGMKLERVWSETQRSALATAFLSVAPAMGGQRLLELEGLLKRYGVRWATSHRDLCLEAQEGHLSASLSDQRMTCLDRTLDHFAGTIQLLEGADRDLVVRSLDVVIDLPEPESCLRDLTRTVPESLRSEVQELEALLDAAELLSQRGKSQEALAKSHAAVARAIRLDYRPMQARAWYARGSLELDAGLYAEALESMRASTLAAAAAGLPDEQVKAYGRRAHILGAQLADFPAAETPMKMAIALLESGESGLSTRSKVLLDISDVLYKKGAHEQSLQRLEEAMTTLAMRSESPDKQKQEARALVRRGEIQYRQGDFVQAMQSHEQALKVLELLYGDTHESLAHVHSEISGVWQRTGELEKARESLAKSVQIRGRLAAPNHTFTRLLSEGKLAEGAEAVRILRLAVESGTALYGTGHIDVAAALTVLAEVLAEEGAVDEAMEKYDLAISIAERVLGPTNSALAQYLVHPLDLLLELEQTERLVVDARRALELTGTGGEQPLVRFAARVSLGAALQSQEKWQEARSVFLVVRKEAKALEWLLGLEFVALADFWVAVSDFELGEGAPAVDAVLKARMVLLSLGEEASTSLESVDEWLEEHSIVP